jgi:hypothetical protein
MLMKQDFQAIPGAFDAFQAWISFRKSCNGNVMVPIPEKDRPNGLFFPKTHGQSSPEWKKYSFRCGKFIVLWTCAVQVETFNAQVKRHVVVK